MDAQVRAVGDGPKNPGRSLLSLPSFHRNSYGRKVSPTRHAEPSNFPRKSLKTITVATRYSTLENAPSRHQNALWRLAKKKRGSGFDKNARRNPHTKRDPSTPLCKRAPSLALLRSGLRCLSDRRPDDTAKKEGRREKVSEPRARIR
jgi:hypothetical protein